MYKLCRHIRTAENKKPRIRGAFAAPKGAIR